MKIAKLKTVLLTAVLLLAMLTGCTNAKLITSVTDNTLYQYDSGNMLPCYLNNAMMGVDTEILESDTLKGYVNEYTLELYDDDVFILFCNMYNQSLEEMEAAEARDCLLDYFKDSAVSLNLSKVTGRYFLGEDVSPMTGKTTDFYKIVFSGAKIDVNGTSFEGQAALLAYENICIAAIIGTVDNQIPEADISNMIKSASFVESENFSTGDGSKPSYKVPDDLQLNIQDDDADTDDEEDDGSFDDIDDTESEEEDGYESEEDDDEANDDPRPASDSSSSSDVYATSLTINGISISYPFTYDDLTDAGFTCEDGSSYEVDANNTAVMNFTKDDIGTFNVIFSNSTAAPLPVSDCDVFGISVNINDLEPSTKVVLGSGIILGSATKEDFSAPSFPEPDFEYDDDNGDFYSIDFNRPGDDMFENSFDFWDGILEEITLYFPIE